MRGPLVPQPIFQHQQFILYNGELFGGKPAILPNANDTKIIFEHVKDDIESIQEAEGPFALIQYKDAKLSFLRDRIGRRSLMYHDPSIYRQTNLEAVCPVAFVTSVWPVGIPDPAVEVQPGVSYLMDLALPSPTCYPQKTLWSPYLVSQDISPEPYDAPAKELQDALEEAVRKRVLQLSSSPATFGSRVALLFSGGIDCTVLAYFAAACLRPDEQIDLLNVAFENPRSLKNKKIADPYDVPDRLTGRQSLAELQGLFPDRRFHFVEINVTMQETLLHREHIMQLMKPHQTEMDYSIGMALYFAARGKGHVATPTGRQDYQSTAKILLSGLGADELFGGYSRHRRAFDSTEDPAEKWTALCDEMQMDLQRIGTRNLGRDDRCISSHGKEARYPFLDERVISFVCQLPINQKCHLALGEGKGDKLILRTLAKSLGLSQASELRKRAMQFGSRSAKRESGKTSGTDVLPP